MDSSYTSGGQDIPGAKPGVIASGPDTPDAPDVPITPENPNGVLSKLSRKPGGSRPPVIVDGSGGPKRKSGRGLLFAGIALIGIALIAGIVAVVLMGKGGGSEATVDVSFNDLINYVTSGKESKSDVNEEYDVANNYYFVDGWSTEEEKTAIYAKTKELMDGFVANYKDGDNQTLNDFVRTTKDLFDFIYAMNSKEKIYDAKTTMTIIKDGDKKAKQKLVENYTFYELADNTYAKSFSELYNDYIDALTNKIKVYSENGCVFGSYIDDECMKDKTTEIFEDVDKYYLDVTSYYDLANSFVENVYGINNLMHGKTLMGDIEEEQNEEQSEEQNGQ